MRLLTAVSLLLLLLILRIPVSGQPETATLGVVNNASYVAPGFPAGDVARGSLVAIFGTGLGPAQITPAPAYPLQKSLAGTSVQVRSGGVSYAAVPLYTSATQVGAILPSVLPEGPAEIRVTYQGANSDLAPIQVAAARPGLFTIDQRGTGPLAAFLYEPNGRAAGWSNVHLSARPGDLVSIWATGLGPITTPDNEIPPVGNLPVDVEVLVGGVPSPSVQYKGRSPGFAGIDQINFTVPEGVSGCYVPVTVLVDGVAGSYGTLSVYSQGNDCADAHSYARQEMAEVRGPLIFGSGNLELMRLHLFAPFLPSEGLVIDRIRGFFREQADQRFLYAWPPVPAAPPLGTCAMYHFKMNTELELLPVDFDRLRPMEAGLEMTVTGPGGTKTLPFVYRQGYQGFLWEYGNGDSQPYLAPGEYTLRNGSGSPDVGAFQASIRVREMIRWTNREQIQVVDRNQPLTVTWTGGDPEAEAAVIMGVGSRLEESQRVTFVCTADPAAGTFTIPAHVTASLPPAPAVATPQFPPGVLLVGTVSRPDQNRFTAAKVKFGFTYSLALTGSAVEIR
ncbi:MAG: hypothetical protein IPM24_19755 [Bryobacterales bacterium]|nr:hypothetical protein [Bryobacterales bacterium]